MVFWVVPSAALRFEDLYVTIVEASLVEVLLILVSRLDMADNTLWHALFCPQLGD